MKYFHKEFADWDAVAARHPRWSIAQIIKTYKQPKWCDYPNAVGGSMGCWSLVGGRIRKRRDCRGCELNAGPWYKRWFRVFQ